MVLLCRQLMLLLLFLLSGVQGDCPVPENPPHAMLRDEELKDSYPVGTVLRYMCNPGYQFIDGSKPFIQCLDNSTWSQTPTFCELKRCTVPVLENGKIEVSGNLELGEEVTFICDEGYRLLGEKTARCTLYEGNKVEWNRPPPFCERIPCERPPNIANGVHSGDVFLDHYTVSTVITYTCDKDFSLIGNSSITCIVAEDGINGKWDRPPPECKVVQCSRPQIPNGKLTSGFQPSYQYEHILQFVCDAGHTLVGSELVKCRADNVWHPGLPTCVKDIFTTHSAPTPTVHPEGDKKNETSGISTTIQPGGNKKNETTGPTQRPSGTVTMEGSGNNNSMAIVPGKLTLILVLLILAV